MRMGSAAHDSTNRSAFRSMMTQEMGEIRAVLTPDQQKQFDDRMAKMRERRQQHDGPYHEVMTATMARHRRRQLVALRPPPPGELIARRAVTGEVRHWAAPRPLDAGAVLPCAADRTARAAPA